MAHNSGSLADIYALRKMGKLTTSIHDLPQATKCEPTAYDLMTPEQRKQAHEDMEAELRRQAAQCG